MVTPKTLEEKITELTVKEMRYTNDYIDRALESDNPIRELTKLLYKYTERIIADKTKLETMNHVVSEQYWK